MVRRVINCFTALLIGVLALMLIPATGSAESPSCEGCVDKVAPQMVEVTYTVNPVHENMVVVQSLPKSHRNDTRYEREYFQRLYGVAISICENAGNTYEAEHVRSYTGFAIQLAQFNTIRQLLNKLLQRSGLGYAPDIEDFSEVWGLEFPVPITHSKGPIVEGYSAGPASLCSFRTV